MRYKLTSWLLVSSGTLLILIALSLSLLTPQPVNAQCGTQASSCKSCHEVQAELPVNNDGTGWHESHAFGDFCTFCHAGNDQATEIDAAHVGMVAPLSDIDTACKACHSDDLMDRALVYATTLNIEIGSGGSPPSQVEPTDTPPTSEAPADEQADTVQPTVSALTSDTASISLPGGNEIVVNDPNVVDYVQRYNEIVLGERPVNWGNIILIALIGLLVVGGGAFILFNEMRMRLASSTTRRVEGEYPAEVVDMLPAIAALKSQSRQSLKRVLNHPKTDKVLGLVDNLVSDEKAQE